MELLRTAVLMVVLFITVTLKVTVGADEILSRKANTTISKKLVYDHYRLPTSIRPEKYRLKITTDLETFKFYGEVKINLIILENTNNITLHARNLTISEPKIKLNLLHRHGLKGKANKFDQNCIKETGTNGRYNYLILKLCRVVRKGDKYLLSIPFSGVLNEDLSGYYRSSYTDQVKNEKRWLSITQFEATSARKAFPCFDEPVYKAKFTVTLGHHKQYKALSNMPLKAQRLMTKEKDWIWSEFEESVPMSTYLVAYSINDFAYKPSETSLKNKVLFRTWARPDAIDQCNYAGEIGPKVLQFYEDTFDIKFPLPKVDQIAIPDFKMLAMENWGLVTYHETSLLYAENISSIFSKQSVASTIAHELAHQWFGNLVTMKWWSDVWLNEGFATFVSTLGVDHIYPEWKFFEAKSIDNLITIFNEDALNDTHPISRPIAETSQIEQNFDNISYRKGSTVLRMMYGFLGEEGFRFGINLYLQTYSYKNAEQDDLWKSLNKVSHAMHLLPDNYDIKTIMDSWTLQAGYPLLTVTRDYEKGTAKITQSRYLANGNSMNSTAKRYCWWVPLAYTTKIELNFKRTTPKAWLECDSDENPINKELSDMPKENEWVIFNLQLTAIYRVKYDQRNWNMLIETLVKDDFQKVDTISRIYHIENALVLAYNGDESYEIPMRLIRYLEHEKEYLPWRTAINTLTPVEENIRGKLGYIYFKKYMTKILEPIYVHLHGLNTTNIVRSADSFKINQHKVLIGSWACRFEVSDCIPRTMRYFAEWRKTPNPDTDNPIPADLRSIIYCNAIRNGNAEDWNFLKERFEKSNVAFEKLLLATSLGCSQEPSILHNLLNLTYFGDSFVRKRDSADIFDSVTHSPVGLRLAKKFIKKNLKVLVKFDVLALLMSLARQISNRADFEDLKRFIEKNKKYFGKQDTRQTLEMALTKVQWVEKNYEDFLRILKDKKFEL